MVAAEQLAEVARFAVSSVGESLLTGIVPKDVASGLAASEVKDVLPLIVLTVGSHTGKPMTCQMIPGRNDSLTISPARAGTCPLIPKSVGVHRVPPSALSQLPMDASIATLSRLVALLQH